MPIVRIDDNGKEIVEAKRKRNAKIVAAVSAAGMVVSTLLFFFVSPEAGIFAGLWPVTIAAVTNLVDD